MENESQSIPDKSSGISGTVSLLLEVAKRPSGLFGLLVILILAVMLIFAEVLAPYDSAQQDIPNRLQGPSLEHPLGTDQLGRDLLSRLIFGTRIALGTAFPAVLGAMLGGLLLGLIAGYEGGNVDAVLLLLIDSMQAFPAVILALALLALLGPSTANVILVIIISFMPGYARVTRAQVLSVKQNPYIEVEQSLGASRLRIIFIHILPNVVAPMLILLAMDLPYAVTFESGLSFLGLGVKPPTPSWGVILSDGFSKIRNTPWPVLWAGLALMLTTLGFTLFGETLRDLLDPKLAGSRRR